MKPTDTPRTDDEWDTLIVSSPWDAAAEHMAQHARQLERELADLTEDVGKCHDALGEDRASDTSELWKFFETHKQLIHRLRCREDELAELTKWREMIDREVGTLREELAAERENHAMSKIAIRMLKSDLEGERELADRLAKGGDALLTGYNTSSWDSPMEKGDVDDCERALAAWKEARSEKA